MPLLAIEHRKQAMTNSPPLATSRQYVSVRCKQQTETWAPLFVVWLNFKRKTRQAEPLLLLTHGFEKVHCYGTVHSRVWPYSRPRTSMMSGEHIWNVCEISRNERAKIPFRWNRETLFKNYNHKCRNERYSMWSGPITPRAASISTKWTHSSL